MNIRFASNLIQVGRFFNPLQIEISVLVHFGTGKATLPHLCVFSRIFICRNGTCGIKKFQEGIQANSLVDKRSRGLHVTSLTSLPSLPSPSLPQGGGGGGFFSPRVFEREGGGRERGSQ